jgi:hypothetical protein
MKSKDNIRFYFPDDLLKLYNVEQKSQTSDSKMLQAVPAKHKQPTPVRIHYRIIKHDNSLIDIWRQIT